MYSAATKSLATIALAALMTACSGNADKLDASALLAEARQAYDTHQYELAVELTDSLHKAFPSATAERRSAMHLRALAMEGVITEQAAVVDSTILALQAQGDSLYTLIHKADFSKPGSESSPVMTALTDQYGRVMEDMRIAMLHKEKLEQQLTVARNQIARTSQDSIQ